MGSISFYQRCGVFTNSFVLEPIKKSEAFLPRSSKKQVLLQGNLCADFLELLLQSLSLFLGDAGLHHLRCAVNKLLCLLEAEGSCLTDNLDDLNLVCADLGELSTFWLTL